jgi:hypothetical protein
MVPLPIEDILLHVRDTLATDGRVGELGLDVQCEDEVVVVRGAITTDARRLGVRPLVIEVLREYDCALPVRDDTHVPSAEAPDREPEQL